MFFVVSSRFLGSFGAVPAGVFSIFFLLPLLRGKVGNSNGRRTHTTRLDHAYLENIRSPEILLRQSKAGTLYILSFYHSWSEIEVSDKTLEPGKHFECVPPKPATHFSHQARLRQLFSLIFIFNLWEWVTCAQPSNVAKSVLPLGAGMLAGYKISEFSQ